MILTASRAHAAAMAAIHAGAFPPGARWGEETFTAQLALPGVFGLIDPEGGFILLRVVVEEAEVLTLAVAVAAQRRGLGRALLAAAMARAQAKGARRILLEVSERNETARALYGAAGFAEIGRRRRYYADGADALVLAAML
ncbi:MAG TPA: GNAT family N-acetyltransferase [Acetobacteraceae bacterium]|nr:GNAT family N-acetyltransferase [Acetobacteraceae bacterium]